MNNAMARSCLKLGTILEGGIFALMYGGAIGTVGGVVMRIAHASPGAISATEVVAATVAMGTAVVIANKNYGVIQLMIENKIKRIPELRFFRKTHTEEQTEGIINDLATLETKTFILGSGIAAGIATMLIS